MRSKRATRTSNPQSRTNWGTRWASLIASRTVATMHGYHGTSDSSKRTLEDDDRDAVRAAYTARTDAELAEVRGCSAAGAGRSCSWGMWLALLAVAIGVRSRRRERRSKPPAADAEIESLRAEVERQRRRLREHSVNEGRLHARIAELETELVATKRKLAE